ncbi:MAG: DUF4129 domain-containing protein [Capsulimonadaceae bacterium]|nr:DUF4129 domain-containing protein [Capsulimonadaceae bacterium]
MSCVSIGRLGKCLLSATVVCAALIGPASAQGLPTLTRAGYDGALARVQAAVNRDRTANTRTAPAVLSRYLRCKVIFPGDSSLVFVDNLGLMSRLTFAESASAAARPTLLREIRDDIVATRQGLRLDGHASPGQVQREAAAMRKVLSGEAYSSIPVPEPTKWDKVLAKWQKAWDDFWAKHFKGPRVHFKPFAFNKHIARTILIAIALLAVAIIIWFRAGLIAFFVGLAVAISNWMRERLYGRNRTAPETNLAIGADEAVLVALRDFERLFDLARRYASRGDYRSAFRLVYVAILVRLDSEGIVQLKRSLTNWEYLAAVNDGKFPALYDQLLPATRDFDCIWYGFHQASAGDYDRIVRQYEALQTQREVTL